MSQVSISRARLDEINTSLARASDLEIFCVLLAVRRRLQAEQAEVLLIHIDKVLEAYDAAIAPDQ